MGNVITIDTNDLSEIICDATSPLNLKKKQVQELRKTFMKKVFEKNPNAVVIGDSFSSVKKKYATRLRNAGFTGKGRPTSEQRAAAMSLMNENEIRIMEFGISKKWCKEVPAHFVVNPTKAMLSLRS